MIYRALFLAICFCVGVCSSATAQNLITNGNFENTAGLNIIAPPCGYFTGLQGWRATHGTPEFVSAGGMIGPNHLRMWNTNAGNGEGVSATLTQATEDRRDYTLCLWYRVYTAPLNLMIVLHNSNVTSNFGACGDPVPNFGATQVFGPFNLAVTNNTWTSLVVPIPANGAYSELAIYPLGTVPGTASTLHLDGVALTTCDPALSVDHLFSPAAAGYYERSNYIEAGSFLTPPGSSTPVSPNPGMNTTFHAGNSVWLVQNFLANPVAGNFFLAELGPCTSCADGLARMGASDLSEGDGSANDWPSEELFLSAQPNPTRGMFTIEAQAVRGATVEVLDLFGRTVGEKTALANGRAQIDLSSRPAGVYIVRLVAANGTRTLRIVKE